MATLAVLLEPPIVVWPGGKKSGPKGHGQNGEGDLGLTHHSIVREVHRSLHEDHRDHAHSDRGAESFLGTHLLPENEGFQDHAGHDSRYHGGGPNDRPELAGNPTGGMILLEKTDRAQISDGASEKAKEGILGRAQNRHGEPKA